MYGATAAEHDGEPSVDPVVSRRLTVVLAAAGVVVLVVAYGAWVLTRPPPLAEPLPAAVQCIAAPAGTFVTHGTVTLQNRTDHPLDVHTLRLENGRGLLITGVPMFVPVQDVVVGNQAGYPPESSSTDARIGWLEQRPISNGQVPPRSSGVMNLMVGLHVLPNVPDPSFSSLAMDYSSGWRTYTWHSNTPVVIRTGGGAAC